MPRKSKAKWEFGDFQTPARLANEAVSVLARLGIKPLSVIEPTCGRGSFVMAAARAFPTAKNIVGVDINREYLAELSAHIKKIGNPEGR